MLGDNIKRIRKEKGLTQNQLSEKLQVAEITVRKWEKGEREPNLETIRNIAAILGVTPAELIGKENSKVILEEIVQISESMCHRLQNMALGIMNITGLSEEESRDALAANLFEKVLDLINIPTQISLTELEELITSDDFKCIMQYLLFKYKNKDSGQLND